MDKRQFLGATALAACAIPAIAAGSAVAGPALLTITGAIKRGNRAPFDPLLDQMMLKQKIQFEKAFAFDFAALQRLPAVSIQPTLEYDSKVHTLRGPLLADVATAAGAQLRAEGKLVLRAVDGYAVSLSVAQARARRFIVATHLDGKPMALGGLGPLWAVYDADRFPDMAARPLAERFGNCPWALYHIEVQA